MLVTYASPTLSIKHAVLPRSVVVSSDILHTVVALFSAFTNHFFIPFAAPRAPPVALCFVSTLLLVLFFLSYWSAALPFLSPLYFLFASPPRLTSCPLTPCCSPISAHFFCCCLCCPPVVPPRPFPLRRASHLKPPNIYYSPSPSSLHCKTYTSRPPFTPPPRHDCEHPFHRIQCSN
jgi:hypothetical protein